MIEHEMGIAIQPLVRDYDACEELEQRRENFLSIASHEFRTPLTILNLQADLLNKRLARQGLHAYGEVLAQMKAQIQKLERLNRDLLHVSKIQADGLEYVEESVDLNQVLHDVVDVTHQMYPTHTIAVRGRAKAFLIGDKGRLDQVFVNLLSNAIKYSPFASTVEIDICSSEQEITIRVHDYGIGIPQEQCEKIFERFYRVVDASTETLPGLGMGLYIVAEIIKHHRGTISVASVVGKGSTFQVVLPLNT